MPEKGIAHKNTYFYIIDQPSTLSYVSQRGEIAIILYVMNELNGDKS